MRFGILLQQARRFTEYVNTWLKIKQEASGWLSWVGSDPVKRQEYVGDYQRKKTFNSIPAKLRKTLDFDRWPNSCLTRSGENLASGRTL